MSFLWFLLGGVAGGAATYVAQKEGLIHEGQSLDRRTVGQAVFAAFGPPGRRRRYELSHHDPHGWFVELTEEVWHGRPGDRKIVKAWHAVDAGDAIRFEEIALRETIEPYFAGEGLRLPRKQGQQVQYSAHGKTLVVKRTRNRSYFMSIVGTHGHARWADFAADARHDIQYFLDTGALPRSGVMW